MRKRYRFLSKKGEGTFSEVLKAKSIATNEMVATKCMKEHFNSIEEVNNLREIQALKRLNPHENIINLFEVVYEKKSGRLSLVFELMDMNLYMFIRKTNGYVPDSKVMSFMHQLLRAIDHMHKRGIFHRDIKPENILISGGKLKLADFGSCRGKYSKQPFTEYISTRWYRAPECLLTDGWYDSKMDIWGVGCVFFEILALFPLFPGTNELDQIERVHRVLGTPSTKLLEKFKKRSSHIRFDFKPIKGTGILTLVPHASPEAVSLINQLLIYDPKRRITGYQSLKHRYFDKLHQLNASKNGSHDMDNSDIKGTNIMPLTTKKMSMSTNQNQKEEHVKIKKSNIQIEVNKASQTHKYLKKNTTTTHRKHDEKRRRKQSYRYKKLTQVYQTDKQQTQHHKHAHGQGHSHHHHHHHGHHRHGGNHHHHRHKLKKDKHSRTQIRLPKVKKQKTLRPVPAKKKSMIAMSNIPKLQHAKSTVALSSSFEPKKLLPSIHSKKYGSLKHSKSIKQHSRFWRKKLPPVAATLTKK